LILEPTLQRGLDWRRSRVSPAPSDATGRGWLSSSNPTKAFRPAMPGGSCVDGPDRGPTFLETGPSRTRDATLSRKVG
jgi:hypothetical protein